MDEDKPLLSPRLRHLYVLRKEPAAIVPCPRSKTVVFLCFLSIIISYSDRANLSVAVLAIKEEYGWGQQQEGYALAAFFYGYIISQVPGGWLAHRFGGKKVLGAGIFFCSLSAMLHQVAASAGFEWFVAVRLLVGLGEGVAFPAIHHLLICWVPSQQSSRAVAFVTSASYVGTVFALGLSPWLIHARGWPAVFYFFGSLGLVWVPIWFYASADSPKKAKNISEQERNYIQENTPPHCFLDLEYRQPVPWRVLLTSGPVWAIIINQFCNSWGFYILLSWLPEYFSQVHGVELRNLTAFIVMPYICQGALGLASGFAADALVSRGVQVLRVRQLMQCMGMLGACVFLLAAVYIATTPALAMVAMSLSLGTNAATLAGVSVSHLDITPSTSGVTFAIGNTAGQLAGILGVPLTGVILAVTSSWPLVLNIGAATYAFGALAWLLLASDRDILAPKPLFS